MTGKNSNEKQSNRNGNGILSFFAGSTNNVDANANANTSSNDELKQKLQPPPPPTTTTKNIENNFNATTKTISTDVTPTPISSSNSSSLSSSPQSQSQLQTQSSKSVAYDILQSVPTRFESLTKPSLAAKKIETSSTKTATNLPPPIGIIETLTRYEAPLHIRSAKRNQKQFQRKTKNGNGNIPKVTQSQSQQLMDDTHDFDDDDDDKTVDYEVNEDDEDMEMESFDDDDDDDDEMMENKRISPRRRGRRMKKVNYFEEDSDFDEDDDDDHDEKGTNETEEEGEVTDNEHDKNQSENQEPKQEDLFEDSEENEENNNNNDDDDEENNSSTTKMIQKGNGKSKPSDIRSFFSPTTNAKSKSLSSVKGTTTKRKSASFLSTSSSTKKAKTTKTTTKKTKKASTKTSSTKKKRKKKEDSESEFENDEDDEEDDDDFESFVDEDDSDVIDNDEDDDYDDFETKPKKSKSKSKRSTTSSTKSNTTTTSKSKKQKTTNTKTTTSTKTNNNKDDEEEDHDNFKPINAPVYPDLSLQEIEQTKTFLDPCGMEATDGIIDKLLKEQVCKVGGLLFRSFANGGLGGSVENRIKLGTACSGTDAPALALILIQEIMELMGLGKSSKMTSIQNDDDGDKGDEMKMNEKRIEFEHIFSCEVEPFKQAYLARNFDSLLYPDIGKLVDDPPADVFGQKREIPPYNLFIAGTSCKNFSMLRTKFRIDIEDKGCSGETFLAACEHLYKAQPEMAIFENVQKAPWKKMQEYITGRVKLSECDKKDQIKDVKDKAKDLEFVKEKDGSIIVDRVPGVYGVRAGAKVIGFLQPQSSKIKEITWPKNRKSAKMCTLQELMKHNDISKANDTLVLDTPVTYCTHFVKVDTKTFGLPQTRNRGYLFVWKPENGNVNDDLGCYWDALVHHFQTPLKYSLESFLLNDDHEIIRRFREALNGPPGRKSRSINFLEQDFWTSASANVKYNKAARKLLGMGDKARPQTAWEPFGVKQIPPHYWLEYINCNNQRIIDMLDILHVSGIRDAESHDSNFASFHWNVSQNATREKHRAATPGIAGCVTPGGDFFVPNKGRPLLGCEKLLIQGLPYFRLALGNETEVQLGDLAGNAMSVTVISACMLASITCKQLRKEMKRKVDVASVRNESRDTKQSNKEKKIRKEFLNDVSNYMSKCGAYENNCTVTNKMESRMPTEKESAPAEEVFRTLASLADEAIHSSIWCTCETSGRNSLTNKFIKCKDCGITWCRNCISKTAGYQLKSHDTEDVTLDYEDHDNAKFQSKLRSLLPTVLIFSKQGLEEIDNKLKDTKKVHRPSLLSNYMFYLTRIKRERMRWVMIYRAREHDNDNVLGEACITLGHIRRHHYCNPTDRPTTGLQVHLTSFLPAQVPPLLRGNLGPFAFMEIFKDQSGLLSVGEWQVKNKCSTTTLTVKGSEPTESTRVRAGLKKDVGKSFEESTKKPNIKKKFANACNRNEKRRWTYVQNWTEYPKVLTISNGGNLDGEYILAPCEQTTNMSSLWIRKDLPTKLYIIIEPNVHRCGPDRAIVTKSIDYKDDVSIIAQFPTIWQPSDALIAKFHSVKGVQLFDFECVEKMKCWLPKNSIEVISSAESCQKGELVEIQGLSHSNIEMLTERVVSNSNEVELPMIGGQKAQQIVRSFNSICSIPIQKHAAEGMFSFKLDSSSPWIQLQPPPSGAAPFGTCEKTIPPRPPENWAYDEERMRWDRRYESGKAREFRLALDCAPKPFQFILNKEKFSLRIKYSAKVAAHKVAYQMIYGRGIQWNEVSASYRFSDTALQKDPVVRPFQVLACDNEEITDVELKGSFELYERQKKVVTKMINIENSKSTFEELEMIEHPLPGSTGLSLISRATRTRNLKGGVIADAIGAGKTVISIAIILKGIERARTSRKAKYTSSATLVVVPPGLLKQWQSEITKFSPKNMNLKVLVIFDFQTLQKYSVKNIRDADVVIIPIDILETKGYFDNLMKIANLDDMKPFPKIPTHSGQKELSGARGIWIPATSTDPYGGGNSPANQANRNESAYYTHVYQAAIQKLRSNLRSEIHESKKGVPIEFFEWDRVFVDEVHESLCTTKTEIDMAKEKAKDKTHFYKEKNRRAGRELLGICIKDPSKRPLLHRNAIFGLTGTPLLDSSDRVIDLANLMGNTYVIGLSSHWRKLEKESSRDIFLENYLEPKQGREVRKAIFEKCQAYLDVAACRNKTGEEMTGISLNVVECNVNMTESEKNLYCESQRGIHVGKRSLSLTPEDFEDASIAPFLIQNAKLESRGKELVKICKQILKEDRNTKIIVFTDGRTYAGEAACQFLQQDEEIGGCTSLSKDDSNEMKNEKISWYQNADATEQDRKRPRVLVLHFEHCAGLNLQSECHNLILFAPLYTGDGGIESDPVGDASTELQAIGRVYRAGQRKNQVNVYKIVVNGPNGEETLDKQILRRNTDESHVAMAINASN